VSCPLVLNLAGPRWFWVLKYLYAAPDFRKFTKFAPHIIRSDVQCGGYFRHILSIVIICEPFSLNENNNNNNDRLTAFDPGQPG